MGLTKLTYRPEIDGLRALAVVPVILFHAGYETFSGGFVGVDVFFVISGYLITSILVADIERGRFSLVAFYERRARRILPALILVMLVCIPFSWMWMLPDPLENFGQSVVATTLFANNILLFLTSGYWDLTSEFKPLLHTWSLAVEEQYYLLFPLFLIGAWRWGKAKLFWLVVGLSFVSLAFAEWSWRNAPEANFFLAPTRAWELLAGSITAFLVQRRGVQSTSLLSMAGLLAILFAIFAFDETTPFPSLYALVPVCGVVLFILYAGTDTLSARLMSFRFLVGMGLISYSAYLWHQPIFAFSRVFARDVPPDWLAPILITCTAALSYASWRFVEQPFRNRNIVSTRVLVSTLSGLSALLVCFGLAAHHSHGFIGRLYDNKVTASDHYIVYNRRNHAYFGSDFSSGSTTKLLVIGDSFGRDVVNILRETYDLTGVELIYRDDLFACDIPERASQTHLFDRADLVVFGANFDVTEKSCIETLIRRANSVGAALFFTGIKQFGYNLNWVVRVPEEERASLRNHPLPDAIAEDEQASRAIPAPHYISMMKPLTNASGILITDDRGYLLSGDRTHLTRYGAIYVGRKVFRDSAISDLLPLKQ